MEALPNTQFKVELENGLSIIAHISGKMRNIISVWYQAIPWKSSWTSTILRRAESFSAQEITNVESEQISFSFH